MNNEVVNVNMDYVYIKKEDVNYWIGKYLPNKDLISIEDLISCIEDLGDEITALKEKLEHEEKDKEDNCRRINPMHQCNVSESDFH